MEQWGANMQKECRDCEVQIDRKCLYKEENIDKANVNRRTAYIWRSNTRSKEKNK